MIRDNLTNCSALVKTLVDSIRQEELILERLITAVSKGDSAAVLAASAELAAHRLSTKAENCAA